MKSLLDPRFPYVPAARTNVRDTIERERQRLAALAQQQKTPPQPQQSAK